MEMLKTNAALLLSLSCTLLVTVVPAPAQQRSQYLSGMSATLAGTMPDEGFSYSNIFYYDSSNRLKGPNGRPIPVNGQYAIVADNNLIVYVTKYKILGANIGMVGDIVIATGSLATSVADTDFKVHGGGGGLGNTWIAPFLLGWHLKRMDIQAGYGFYAPTGRYTQGASNNIGTGYWSNELQAAVTFYVTKNKGTQISAFNTYTFNTQQQGTGITPGQNDCFDYSLTQMLPLNKKMTWLVQVGPAGYGQWQTTNSSRQIAALAGLRYEVNGLGFVANLVSPSKKLLLGTSGFWEIGAVNTREGHVVMVQASITLK